MDQDKDAAVTPHQLCECCQKVAAAYEPDPSWNRDKFLKGLGKQEAQRLCNTYKETRGLEPLDKTPDIVLYWRSKQPIEHHADWVHLEESAENGCHLCALFIGIKRRAANEKFSGSSTEQRQLYIAPLRRFRQFPRGTCMSIGLFAVEPGLVGSEYRASTKPVAAAVLDLHYRPRCFNLDTIGDHPSVFEVEDDTNSPQSRFRWARTTEAAAGREFMDSLLSECIRNHESCREGMNSKVPKRLLDLGVYEHDVRLVSGLEAVLITDEPYATLSYRRGTSSTVALTHETHIDFLTRIYLDSLPQTIQDAIQFCRGVLVRYLWVDALCIIQGDEEDFSEEIARMGTIYANSVFTIAAAASVDSSGGLHGPRFPLYQEDCLMWQDEESLLYCAGPVRDQSLHQHQISALDGRAWVYQERMMTRRTIHFNANEMVWECRELQACQGCMSHAVRRPTRHASLLDALNPKELFSKLEQALLCETVLPFRQVSDTEPEYLNNINIDIRLQMFWNQIIKDFSQKSLTFDNDRLSALAGLASVPQRHLEYNASFGLWHLNFTNQLLWIATETSRRYNSLVEDSPSWSWIRIDGGVEPLLNQTTAPPELLPQRTINCATISILPAPTPFGPVTSSYKSIPDARSFEIRSKLFHCRPVPRKPLRPGVFSWSLVPGPNVSEESSMARFAAAAWDIHQRSSSALEGFDSASVAFRQLGLETQSTDHYLAQLKRITYYPDTEPAGPGQTALTCLFVKRVLYVDEFAGTGTGTGRLVLADYGLVLERLDERPGSCYRRVGAFKEELLCKTVGCAELHRRDHESRYVHGIAEGDHLRTMGNCLMMFSDETPESTIWVF